MSGNIEKWGTKVEKVSKVGGGFKLGMKSSI
jgi:hypothetical protein